MQRREQYAQDGPERLGDTELLALILGSGAQGRSALELSAQLLTVFGGLSGLAQAEPARMAQIQGIGLTRSVRLHAAFQAGRRSMCSAPRAVTVRGPVDAWQALYPRMRGLRQEELHGLYLDRRRRLVGRRQLTRGSDAFTVVDPRQIFREAVELGASAVVLAHNHPSGDPSPSAQDRDVTRRVASAGRILGIQLVDHLVICDEGWASMAELGDLPAWRPPSAEWVTEPTVSQGVERRPGAVRVG